MSLKKPRKFPIVPPILPEEVPNFAWGLTHENSEEEGAKDRAEKIRTRIKQIKTDVYEKAKSKKASEREKADRRYLDNVLAAMDSCERTLLTIIRGRNLNFNETDRLMETEKKNAEAASRVMLNFQSALPRAFATGGGAAGMVIVNFILEMFKIEIPDIVIASAAVVAAGVVFGIHEWMFVPRARRRAQLEIIKNDYRRNKYFRDYLSRSRSSLNALFSEVLNVHERVYGKKYCKTKYDNLDEREKVVMNAMGGSKALYGKQCPKIHKHYQKNKITPDEWSTCESGQDYEKCKKWPENDD